MATYSSVLAWRIPGTHRVGHDLVSEHTHTHTHTHRADYYYFVFFLISIPSLFTVV